MSFMWIMAQYVVYTYKESIESDMIKAYGYDIKKLEENNVKD